MKGQIIELIKQAKNMQNNVKKIQKKLSLINVEGQSGAGLVKIIMTCKNKVKRIFIDTSLLKEDKDMLEDLIAAAFNDAIRKAKIIFKEKMNCNKNNMDINSNILNWINFS